MQHWGMPGNGKARRGVLYPGWRTGGCCLLDDMIVVVRKQESRAVASYFKVVWPSVQTACSI